MLPHVSNEGISAWLISAAGCVDKMCCSTGMYSGQVDNEIHEEECEVRSKDYWKTVEETLSASIDSEEDDNVSKDNERDVNRISVDAFITPESSHRTESEPTNAGKVALKPLVLSPLHVHDIDACTPPISNKKCVHLYSRDTNAQGSSRTGKTTKFVMEIPNEINKDRDTKNKIASRARSFMPGRRRVGRGVPFFRHRALDYHSLGSAESFKNHSRLLAEAADDTCSINSSFSTVVSTDGDSMSITSGHRGTHHKVVVHVVNNDVFHGNRNFEEFGSQGMRKSSFREVMDESLPYLTMAEGYKV